MIKVVERVGTSATGSKHGLRVEMTDNGVRFTVTGVNGTRHASVLLPLEDSGDVAGQVSEWVIRVRLLGEEEQ
jgi:hypothetical protein